MPMNFLPRFDNGPVGMPAPVMAPRTMRGGHVDDGGDGMPVPFIPGMQDIPAGQHLVDDDEPKLPRKVRMNQILDELRQAMIEARLAKLIQARERM